MNDRSRPRRKRLNSVLSRGSVANGNNGKVNTGKLTSTARYMGDYCD